MLKKYIFKNLWNFWNIFVLHHNNARAGVQILEISFAEKCFLQKKL